MSENESGSPANGRKGGAPRGNTNAVRHGLRGSKLPKNLRYVEHRVNELRRQLEAAVVQIKGEISLTDAACINSAIRWERHASLAAHWLRKEIDKLSAGDRLRFSEATAKAGDNRDKNIRLLGLEEKADNILDALYARVVPSLPVANADGAGGTEDK